MFSPYFYSTVSVHGLGIEVHRRNEYKTKVALYNPLVLF